MRLRIAGENARDGARKPQFILFNADKSLECRQLPPPLCTLGQFCSGIQVSATHA
jgi:hypothetical protein